MATLNFNDDHAMTYEYFIRKAYHVGRHGVGGADADTFRRLQRMAAVYDERKNEKNLIAYMVCVGEIYGYIKSAIWWVMNKNGGLTDEQWQTLDNIMVAMLEPDLAKLITAINEADEIFLALGLKVG